MQKQDMHKPFLPVATAVSRLWSAVTKTLTDLRIGSPQESTTDPFAVLPLELSVRILFLVQRNVWHRPRYLRAPLQVSKLWKSVASQPELWSDLDLPWLDAVAVEGVKRRLRRVQGGLRSLRMDYTTLSSGLWDEAIPDACTSAALDDFWLYFKDPLVLGRIPVMTETVASSSLRSLAIKGLGGPNVHMLVREILQRVLHLRTLEIDIDLGESALPPQLETWLPDLSQADEHGIHPLEKLEALTISAWCPSLWEHLSRRGVKLAGLSLLPPFYGLEVHGLDGFQSRDPSGRVLRHILDVISGPHLRDFRFITWYNGLVHPEIVASVFKHPRRSLAMSLCGYQQAAAMLDPRPIVGTLEKLELHFCPEALFDTWFGQSYARLRHLAFRLPYGEDANLASAIRAAAGSLELLDIVFSDWPKEGEQGGPMEQTLAAIGTVSSLRSLRLQGSSRISYSMVEPLVIGVPPSRPPLCPMIWEAYFVGLQGDGKEFEQRLRESIKQRFPVDGMVNGQPVSTPWNSRSKKL